MKAYGTSKKLLNTKIEPHLDGSIKNNCRRGDLNPHSSRHMHLKHACLPFHHIDIIGLFYFTDVGRLLVVEGCRPLSTNNSLDCWSRQSTNIDIIGLFYFTDVGRLLVVEVLRPLSKNVTFSLVFLGRSR